MENKKFRSINGTSVDVIKSQPRKNGGNRSNPNQARQRPSNQNLTKRQVRQMIDSKVALISEQKYLSNNLSFTTDYNGTLTSQNIIPQGDTDNTRDGDSCLLKKTRMAFSVQLADTTNLVRVMMLQWKPYSTPAVSAILFNTGSIVSPLSSLNKDQNQQYTVLYDRVFYLHAGNALDGDVIEVTPSSEHLQFVAGTTSGTNQLYLLTISDSSAASHPIFSAYVTSYFTDS
jgi:hypothetical protein